MGKLHHSPELFCSTRQWKEKREMELSGLPTVLEGVQSPLRGFSDSPPQASSPPHFQPSGRWAVSQLPSRVRAGYQACSFSQATPYALALVKIAAGLPSQGNRAIQAACRDLLRPWVHGWPRQSLYWKLLVTGSVLQPPAWVSESLFTTCFSFGLPWQLLTNVFLLNYFPCNLPLQTCPHYCQHSQLHAFPWKCACSVLW